MKLVTRPRVHPRRRTVRRWHRNRKLRGPLWSRLPSREKIASAVKVSTRRGLPFVIALLVVATASTAGVLAHRWLTTSERFAIAEIELRGNEILSRDAILERLEVGVGDNIFATDLTRLEAVLEQDPWIDHADLDRQLPDRLIVTVVENHAVAVVDLGGLYLCDQAGRIFKRVVTGQGEASGLPVITGLTRQQYLRDPAAVEAEIRGGLAAITEYRANLERPALGEIHLDIRQGITFLTYEDGIAIRVGHGEPQALKRRLHTFDRAWASLTPTERDTARIVYVDNLTRPDRVTVGFEPARAN